MRFLLGQAGARHHNADAEGRLVAVAAMLAERRVANQLTRSVRAAAWLGLSIPAAYRIEQKMNMSMADNTVQWLFLDLNAFFASCEQQEAPALRGKPVIVVQTLSDSAVAIAASYAAKAFGIKTGTVVREARRLCPDVIPVQANHRLYTDYHERILKAVDTCLPVDKVMSIDEMACRLMGTERQVDVARELALKVKRALREQVGECLTCSIGIAPNVFLGKVGSDLQKPDGLVIITHDDLPDILLGLELQEIYGIGEPMEQRLHRAGIFTVAELWQASPMRLRTGLPATAGKPGKIPLPSSMAGANSVASV
jgi:DNA polymerase IV